MAAPLLALLAPLLGRFAGGAAARLAAGVGQSGFLGQLGMGNLGNVLASLGKVPPVRTPPPPGSPPGTLSNPAMDPLVKFGKTLGMVSGGAVTVTLGLKGFAERLVSASEGLRYFNGQISAAYARLEYGDIRRQFSRAQGTAGSTALLVKQVDAMRNVWNDIGTDLSNILNLVGAYAATAAMMIGWLVKIGAAVTPVVIAAKALAKWLPGTNAETDTVGVQFLQDVAREAGKRKLPPLKGFENPEGKF